MQKKAAPQFVSQ